MTDEHEQHPTGRGNDEHAAQSPAPPRRKKSFFRFILKLILVLAILLLVLVAFLPTIASTGAVRQFALDQAGGFVRGKITVDDWKLSWFGPVEVAALNVTDDDGREVLRCDSLSMEKGIWDLVTGGLSLGEIRVAGPKVLVHFDENNDVSLAGTFASDAPAPPPAEDAGPTRLPRIDGHLVISDGTVTFSRDDFESYELRDVALDVEVRSLNEIAGTLATRLPDDKSLSGEIALSGLAPNNELSPGTANGSVRLGTDGQIAVGPLAAVLSGQRGLEGQAEIAIDVQAKPDDIAGTVAVRVIDLASPQVQGRPLNLALTGSGSLRNEQIEATAELAGASEKFMTVTAGGTTADATAQFGANLQQLRAELAQVFELGDLDFSGQADGKMAFKRTPGGEYDTTLDLTVREAALRTGQRNLAASEVQLKHGGTLGQSLRSTGSLVLSNLAAGGKPLDSKAEVTWKQLVVGEAVRAETLNVSTTPLNLDATGLGMNLERGTLDSGSLKLTADLARTMQLAAAAGAFAEPPELSGTFEFAAEATGEQGRQRLRGEGTLREIVIGTGEQAVREDELGLTVDARLDPEAGTITLGENRIRSDKLSLNVQGEIREYTGRAVADLSGDYELSWPAITALLHELVPDTRETVAISGTSKSKLKLSGPLNDPEAQPSFRGLSAGTELRWDKIELYGIPISEATLKPQLNDGELLVPATTMSAVEGKLTLGALLDFKPADVTVRMPGQTKLAEGLRVTPQLTRDLLSRINPIFYPIVETNGQIDLTVNDVVLPLGESLNTGGKGTGKLDLIDMRIQPNGIVSQLVTLAGLGNAEEMLAIDLRGGDFELADGKISYDDFTIIFPREFDVKFYGAVAFDDTLDLVVSLPIRPDLLRELGVSGDVQRYAELLKDTRIDIPVSGTRQNPKLELSQVDTKKLLEGVIKGGLEQQGKGLLEGVLGGKQQPAGETDEEKADKPANPLGGLIDDLKKKNNDKP